MAAAHGAQDQAEEDAEDKAAVAVELMDREPFCQLTLDAENNSAVIEILPLESVPVDPKPTDRLRVRLVSNPDDATSSKPTAAPSP